MEKGALIRFLQVLPGALALGGGRYALVDPALAGKRREEVAAVLQRWGEGVGCLAIQTGGTGGRVRFARHGEAGLLAAASAFQAHNRIGKVNTVELLPAHHISGLMSRLRAWASGGRSVVEDWRAWARGVWEAPPAGDGDWFCSLVPTQLARIVDLPGVADHLRRFTAIHVGGAPLWPALEARLDELRLPVCPCYGMTETAAMVASVRPGEFLPGESGVGHPMPHASLRVGPDDRVVVECASRFLGYVGEDDTAGPWTTDDLGRLDGVGRLHVLGRVDDVILTGGKKVSASWLEATLRGASGVERLAIVGVDDPVWGQAVVLCLAESPAEKLSSCLAALEAHQRPKRLVIEPSAFAADTGKVNKAVLRECAAREAKGVSRL